MRWQFNWWQMAANQDWEVVWVLTPHALDVFAKAFLNQRATAVFP